jgi:hypothetical protein
MIGVGHRRRWGLWSVAVAAVYAKGVFSFTRQVTDNSFLWHVRAGDAQIDAGAVLTSDPFSFTAQGTPWRTQSWLVELGYSWLDNRIGLWQVAWIVLVCWVLFVTAVLAIVRSQVTSSVKVALMVVMTAFVTIGFFNPRPVVFSFVLLCLLVLADDRPRLRWTIPGILWLWAAIHGSFVIGGLYLVLQATRFRDRTRIPALVAGGLLSLSTAHGVGVLEMLIGFAKGGDTLKMMREWATPDYLSIPFFSVLVGIVLLLIGSMKGAITLRDLWLIVPMLVVMAEANRSVPAGWLFLLLPMSTAIGRSIPDVGRSLVPRSIPFAVAMVPIVALVVAARAPTLSPEMFPVNVASNLEGERVFASDGAGGYLIYAYWPERLVYVDDRAELFTEVLPEMVQVRGAAPAWREAFTRWGFDEAILRTEDPLTGALQAEGWSVAASDEYWVRLRPG